MDAACNAVTAYYWLERATIAPRSMYLAMLSCWSRGEIIHCGLWEVVGLAGSYIGIMCILSRFWILVGENRKPKRTFDQEARKQAKNDSLFRKGERIEIGRI